MKVGLSWLRELCPTEVSAEELAELLTGTGAEVESVGRPWAGLAGVIVARVLEVRDHPSSDRLCVARVQTGSGEQQVVVGVRNMGAGDLVPLAPPGARVPLLPEPLSAREIRGERAGSAVAAIDSNDVASRRRAVESRAAATVREAAGRTDIIGGLDEGVELTAGGELHAHIAGTRELDVVEELGTRIDLAGHAIVAVDPARPRRDRGHLRRRTRRHGAPRHTTGGERIAALRCQRTVDHGAGEPAA